MIECLKSNVDTFMAGTARVVNTKHSTEYYGISQSVLANFLIN